ncbi:uncharacterized protein [Physcomitrium patens]|uniref:uncharacterized protein n=1 Tax=Physcomitrium patens TaxID=3218 RepID=UPI003CCD1143
MSKGRNIFWEIQIGWQSSEGSGWRTVDWVRAKQERQGISRYFEDFKSHIAVSSCIFGAWDNLRTPTNRKISFDSRVRRTTSMLFSTIIIDIVRGKKWHRTKDDPEGSFIVSVHSSMSNLFS